jgi:hypothetical protein
VYIRGESNRKKKRERVREREKEKKRGEERPIHSFPAH